MILDTGVLISAERGEPAARAYFATADRLDVAFHTSEAVVAQVWRGGPRQARLARVLATVEAHPLDDGRAVGAILEESETKDVVDAHLALLAQRLGVDIVTGDVGDLIKVTAGFRSRPRILAWPP